MMDRTQREYQDLMKGLVAYDRDKSLLVSFELIRELGFRPAVLLGYLFSASQQTKSAEGPGNDEWFPCTVDKMQKETGESADQQARALKKLVEGGFIEIKRMGLPAKRHFRIIPEVMQILFSVQQRAEEEALA